MKYFIDKDDIKKVVNVYDIVNFYNLDVKGGFCKCPFHARGNERTASMKIRTQSNTFHCYGCGWKGDVIEFVKAMEKCNFKTAMTFIDNIFRLGLDSRLTINKAKLLEYKIKQAQKKKQKKINAINFERIILNKIINKIKIYEEMQNFSVPATKFFDREMWSILRADMYFHATKKLWWLNWLYDTIAGISNTFDMCIFDSMYGNDKLEILRKIRKGEILIDD